MGYTIGKRFTFSASHRLDGLPDGHQCARLHGHNYTVEVVVGAERLAAPGFVTDFGDLAPMKTYVAEAFDHQHLNDVMDRPPTSENLAEHLAVWFMEHVEPTIAGRLVCVRVGETDSTWAQYTPQ
ncbi:6-carboxytetrahydropterin synthase [Phytohabitans sp. ZYX-F-186]|uniref:6-carboxy-5,6,7,8-tetrahydropterin synthase n=1 Tax=Phytohabitans maris TaxID=3071409 RepID=A0ABU0ZCB2_9ACTN|nr:6-carboxytetrahydropterin synthase [Phytohabitans sp. ZYX-F-186]MDQ7904698.1 6-carboxytetrahydropterin synthase [Phytohabitans sp. ZYX-F-186]